MHSIMTHACVAKGKKEIAVEQRELKYSDDDVVVQVECGGICARIFIITMKDVPDYP